MNTTVIWVPPPRAPTPPRQTPFETISTGGKWFPQPTKSPPLEEKIAPQPQLKFSILPGAGPAPFNIWQPMLLRRPPANEEEASSPQRITPFQVISVPGSWPLPALRRPPTIEREPEVLPRRWTFIAAPTLGQWLPPYLRRPSRPEESLFGLPRPGVPYEVLSRGGIWQPRMLVSPQRIEETPSVVPLRWSLILPPPTRPFVSGNRLVFIARDPGRHFVARDPGRHFEGRSP